MKKAGKRTALKDEKMQTWGQRFPNLWKFGCEWLKVGRSKLSLFFFFFFLTENSHSEI